MMARANILERFMNRTDGGDSGGSDQCRRQRGKYVAPEGVQDRGGIVVGKDEDRMCKP